MNSIDSAATRRAPAKVNLRLEILGKRTDGYHEIRSIMCPVGLFDVVTVRPGHKGFTITANRQTIPLDSTNLAWRAAALFAEKTRLSQGLAIHLEKNIPVGAGLGGGSSDAAAVLHMLNELTGSKYSQAELVTMAATLGSDIPFFCGSGPALAVGRGEQLSPVTLSPPFWVLLVMPPFSVSTAWAYDEYQGVDREPGVFAAKELDLLAAGPDILVNDLEEAVICHFGEIGAMKEVLTKCGAWGSLMSGSGSTVFGIFFEEGQARKTERRLRAEYAEYHWETAVVPALI